MSGKGVATLHQEAAQFRVVINFSVQQDPDRSVLVGKRLMAAGYVNDAQPAVSQTDIGGHIHPGVVRTAVSQGVVHTLDQFAGDWFRAASINDAANAAHFCSLFPTAPRNSLPSRRQPESKHFGWEFTPGACQRSFPSRAAGHARYRAAGATEASRRKSCKLEAAEEGSST